MGEFGGAVGYYITDPNNALLEWNLFALFDPLKIANSIEQRKKKNSYFPLYWLVYRDPYIGLSKSPYKWVV